MAQDTREAPRPSQYSEACWVRFTQPRHAMPPPDAAVCGRAQGRADDSEVLIWLRSSDRQAGFLAHAGPWAVAAADLAVERWLESGEPPQARALANHLSAPPDTMDALVTVEDAFKLALEQIVDMNA